MHDQHDLATKSNIALYRERFASYSDEELRIEQTKWSSHTAPHVAATLILEERTNALAETAARRLWWDRPVGRIALQVSATLVAAAALAALARYAL